METGIPKAHNQTDVLRLPKCDFCDDTARYDGRTALGPSAYMCECHFRQYGVGLGLGKGQRLVMVKPRCKLVRTGGNMFAQAGRVTATLQKSGQPENAKEFADRLFQCKSYDEALALIGEYVEIYW